MPTSKPEQSSSPRASGSRESDGAKSVRIHRGWMLLIAVLAFVLATWDMLRTPPRYDVSRKSGSWAERMFSPIEANAIRRLPVINARLNALSVNPAGTEVCVVGDQGIHPRHEGRRHHLAATLAAGRRSGFRELQPQRAASFCRHSWAPLAKAAQKANPTFNPTRRRKRPIVDSAKAPSSRLSNEQSKALYAHAPTHVIVLAVHRMPPRPHNCPQRNRRRLGCRRRS